MQWATLEFLPMNNSVGFSEMPEALLNVFEIYLLPFQQGGVDWTAMCRHRRNFPFQLRCTFEIDKAQTLSSRVIPIAMRVLVPDSPAPIHIRDRALVFRSQAGRNVGRLHHRISGLDTFLLAAYSKQCLYRTIEVICYGRDASRHFKLKLAVTASKRPIMSPSFGKRLKHGMIVSGMATRIAVTLSRLRIQHHVSSAFIRRRFPSPMETRASLSGKWETAQSRPNLARTATRRRESFCVPGRGAQDAVPKPPSGYCAFGWTASESYCLRGGSGGR
jgi:hypothetical protein